MTDIIIEFNDNGAQAFPDGISGCFARGKTRAEALEKLPRMLARDRAWTGEGTTEDGPLRVTFEYKSDAAVEDADTRVLFPSERLPMDMAEYTRKKALCIRSARDVAALFESIPQKSRALVKSRKCFYGRIPQTAREMLTHINGALSDYAAAVGIAFEPCDDLVENRIRFFKAFEAEPHFLESRVYTAPDGEQWTRRKVLRRILWHDRIHARALYRRAITFWQKDRIENPFRFSPRRAKEAE